MALPSLRQGFDSPYPLQIFHGWGDYMKFNIMNLVAGVIAVLTMIAAVIGADARYIKSDDLENAKNEIINEMRREVSKNRAVMIASMQRSADDIEFQIMEHEQNDQKVPRFLIEKHKQITRQIEDLQDVDRKTDDKK